jgi:hypothetical protein
MHVDQPARGRHLCKKNSRRQERTCAGGRQRLQELSASHLENSTKEKKGGDRIDRRPASTDDFD